MLTMKGSADNIKDPIVDIVIEAWEELEPALDTEPYLLIACSIALMRLLLLGGSYTHY